jgi:archaellin
MKKYALSGLIAFLLVAAVFAAGCMIGENNNSSTQTPSTLTSNVIAQTSSLSSSDKMISHDTTVEKFVNETHNELVKNYSLQAWDVKWLNSTMVNMTYSVKINAPSTVVTLDQSKIIVRLKSTDEATAYLSSLNRTGYKQINEAYPGGGFYDKVVGHNPTIFRMYQKQSDSKLYSLAQLDDTILFAETMVRSG